MRGEEQADPWTCITESDPRWPFGNWPFKKWPFKRRAVPTMADDGSPNSCGVQRCIWLRGEERLLAPEFPRVAIIGTRHPDPEVEERIRGLARELAGQGYVIVSGFAPGIDRAAFDGALEADDGRTIAVLAETPEWNRLPRRLRDVERDPNLRERVLVLTPYPPPTRWSGRNAMDRNLIVVALADAVVVGQVGPEKTPRASGRPRKSGTWHAVREGKRIGRPVFVPSSSLSAGCTRELVDERLAEEWSEDVGDLARLIRLGGGSTGPAESLPQEAQRGLWEHGAVANSGSLPADDDASEPQSAIETAPAGPGQGDAGCQQLLPGIAAPVSKATRTRRSRRSAGKSA